MSTTTDTVEPLDTTPTRHHPELPHRQLRPHEIRRRHRAAEFGTKPIDRFNRVTLALLGLALIAAGALGLTAARDTPSWRPPGAIYRDSARNAADHPGLWTAGAAVLGLALIALGLSWAWNQVRPRAERSRITTAVLARTTNGQTTLEPAALARAAANDLAQIDQVNRARVRLTALHPIPELIAWLELNIDADLATVQTELEEPLERLLQAVDAPAVDCDLRLHFGTQTAPRVQ